MKQVSIAAVALVLGFVLGGLGPRANLRLAEEALSKAEVSRKAGMGADLARLLKAGSQSASPCPPARSGTASGTVAGQPEDPRDTAVREADKLAEENPELAKAVAELNAQQEQATEEIAEGLSEIPGEELDLARTALDLRRAQTRAALVEQLDPEAGQLEALDETYDSMNQVLVELSEDLAGIVADGGVPERHDAMTFAADALDAMLAAEDGARGLLDADQVGNMSDDLLDPFKWIDPSILDALELLEEQ